MAALRSELYSTTSGKMLLRKWKKGKNFKGSGRPGSG
jgi:hypothetical protein